jgi:hypothetical protein
VTILILARDLDPTADHMIDVLGERGVEVFRVNTAWFPTQTRVTARLRGDRWQGALTTPARPARPGADHGGLVPLAGGIPDATGADPSRSAPRAR